MQPFPFERSAFIVHHHPVQGLQRNNIFGEITEPLSVFDQFFAQRVVGHLLHRDSAVDGQGSRRARTLAENHEDRLHANRSIRNMRRGQAEGHQEIAALFLTRHDGSIGYGVGPRTPMAKATLVTHRRFSIYFHDHAMTKVRVHRIGREAHGIIRDTFGLAIVLGHDVIGNHAPPLTNIQLMGPASRFMKRVWSEAEAVCPLLQRLRNLAVVRDEIHEPLLIGDVVLKYPLPNFIQLTKGHGQAPPWRRQLRERRRFVGAVGPEIAAAHIVGRETPGVVAVTIAHLDGPVGHGHRRVVEGPLGRGVKIHKPSQERIAFGIVTIRFGEGQLIRLVGEAHTEVVGLDPEIAVALLSQRIRRNLGEQSGVRVVGFHIGAYWKFAKLIDIAPGNVLHLPTEGLAIGAGWLSAHIVGDIGRSEEIPFVGGVNKHGRLHRFRRLHRCRHQPSFFHDDRLQPTVEKHRHPGLFKHLQEEGFRLRGIEVTESADTRVVFQRQPADGGPVAHVSGRQSAGSQSTHKAIGGEQDGLFAHPPGLNRRRPPRGRAAINGHVEGNFLWRTRRNRVVIAKCGHIWIIIAPA